MNTFINDTSNEIIKCYKLKEKTNKYNYFSFYESCISSLDEDKKDKIYNIIDKNKDSLDSYVIEDITNFLSYDLSNKFVEIDNDKIRNYIVFCIFCYIIEGKIDKIYFNEHNILRLDYKDRPHRFVGTVYSYSTNDFICDVNAFRFSDIKLLKEISKKFTKMKKDNMVLPYCDLYDNIVVYEKLVNLDPYNDPLITVLKDVVNQLKSINKHYFFEYIDKKDIGKSNINFNRFFVNSFDTIIDKKTKVKCFNEYDGRDSYETITNKDQLRTLIHILSDIYVTGNDSYKEKCKMKPFNYYLRYLDELDDKTCHEEFIYYLMDIKI